MVTYYIGCDTTMNNYMKLDKIKTGLTEYMQKLEAYGKDISTTKVINELNKILKECE